jgi:uncharacterized protein (DUF433 family)
MPERKRLETIVLEMEPDGVIRIGGTRVPLETVIAAFQDGATPEEIVQQYPSIPLGDVYQVVGYYLSHRAEIESYLDTRLSQASQTKQANEARWKPDGIRERLLSRRRGPSRG